MTWKTALYAARPRALRGAGVRSTMHLFASFFFFSSRRRHTISLCDWSSDVCSSDLEQLTYLSWRSDPSVAKVAFWVGAAPQHDNRGTAMKQAILGAHAAGIHVYPVSASGTNDLLERSEERRVGKECRSRWSPYH